jgi:hypothetical protein
VRRIEVQRIESEQIAAVIDAERILGFLFARPDIVAGVSMTPISQCRWARAAGFGGRVLLVLPGCRWLAGFDILSGRMPKRSPRDGHRVCRHGGSIAPSRRAAFPSEGSACSITTYLP